MSFGEIKSSLWIVVVKLEEKIFLLSRDIPHRDFSWGGRLLSKAYIMELNEIIHKMAYRKIWYARLGYVTGVLQLLKFWRIMAKRFSPYKELERELAVYWFCLNS